MRKTILLLSFSAFACAANAQLTLTGTSYSQNFDAMWTSGGDLPTGWHGFIAATSSSLGVDTTLSGNVGTSHFGLYCDSLGVDTGSTGCTADIYGRGFKQCASNDAGGGNDLMTCIAQEAVSNRALAVRLVSGTPWDPGVAFAFYIANTTGFHNFQANFKLESLDITCPRVSTWEVDYGIGSSPSTFTAITGSAITGTLTTGGLTFTNNLITANFGTALDNITSPVWIRVASINATTGTGTRTTTGIDDFNLTWTTSATSGVTNVTAQPALSLSVLGNATSSSITLGYNVDQEGTYTLALYDMTGRTLHTVNVNAQTGLQQLNIGGLNLAPGMYFARMANGNSSSVARIMIP